MFPDALRGSARFWRSIINDLKNRGLEDSLIAVVPYRGSPANPCREMVGFKGLPDPFHDPSHAPDTAMRQ